MRGIFMDDFQLGADQYCQALPDLLDTAMRLLAERTQLLDGTLWLNETDTLVLDRSGRELKSAWLHDVRRTEPPGHEGVGEPRAQAVDDAVRTAETAVAASHGLRRERQGAAQAITAISWPISYADAALGEIRLRWRGSPGREQLAQCQEFARQCGFAVKRHEVQRWSEQRLGRPLLLVGASKSLQELEAFVERVVRSGLPVLITGEFGTEKALLAASIHSCGPRRDGPFIEVNCADPAGTPAQWFEQAKGGSLFLSGIDELPLSLQNQIPQQMHSSFGQWLVTSGASDLRVIASTASDLSERVRDGRFSRALLVELDFLSVTVPPLRERLADIEPLVGSILERHGHRSDQKRSNALISICKAHSWPDNLFELERVIARLAVMTDGQPIQHVDILRHTPWIATQAPLSPAADVMEDALAESNGEDAAAAVPEHWVRCAISRDMAALKKLHESLKKALLYLGEHYAEPISLGQLAQQAHVSPSHLTFLFRSELGTAFKPFLLRIRVQKAKEMMTADPRMRITEVAMSVGFTDLSHFEKSFRRIVGRRPREFRRNGNGL